MAYKNLLITLLLIPALAFGADEPSQEFLDTLTLAEQGDALDPLDQCLALMKK